MELLPKLALEMVVGVDHQRWSLESPILGNGRHRWVLKFSPEMIVKGGLQRWQLEYSPELVTRVAS